MWNSIQLQFFCKNFVAVDNHLANNRVTPGNHIVWWPGLTLTALLLVILPPLVKVVYANNYTFSLINFLLVKEKKMYFTT